MSYSIFISHAEIDKPIAKAIYKTMNDAYQGYIIFYLAHEHIVGGDDWKKEIRENLYKCDAIISIITKESIKSPWLYLEWSPFWIHDRTSFTLLTSDVRVVDLPAPMQDIQYIDMNDQENLKLFIDGLSERSEANIPKPYSYIEQLISKIKEAQWEKTKNSIGIYRKRLDMLPKNDFKKEEIAEKFYELNELDNFKNVVNAINDDTITKNIVLNCLNDGRLERDDKLRLTHEITQSMNSAEKIAIIAIDLISFGYEDSVYLKEMLKNLSIYNQAELRKVAIYLASNNLEDSELFNYICDISTNLAELRKVANYFVSNNRFDSIGYEKLIEKIDTVAQLRQIAKEYIKYGYQDSDKFKDIIETIYYKDTQQFNNIIDDIRRHDPQLVEVLEKKFTS